MLIEEKQHSSAPTTDVDMTLTVGPDRLAFRAAKRAIDLLAAIFLMVICSPVMLIVALAIKAESPGPVIFRQTRVGRFGKTFTMYKFRSMYQNADARLHEEHMRRLILQAGESEAGAPCGKLAHDPRITRVGRILRKTSLDELPQIFNVLKGDMSLVGPRPALPYEIVLYSDWERRRLEVKPGVTSLWAIAGRADVPFREQVRLDIEYIERQSLGLDLWILLRTPVVILTGKGAG